MAAASALFKKKRNRAGLALHDNDLKYIELDGDPSKMRVARKISTPSGGRGVRKNSLADAGELLAPLQALGSSIGGFKAPVAMSIPSRDVLIRVIEMPELPLEDAREALQWDFEKYFPYAFSDAAVDIAMIENPSAPEAGNMSLLVAACKLRTIESLTRLADTAKLPLSTIEPENVAMFRAVLGPTLSFPNGYLAVFAEEGICQLVLGYRDNGVLYRTSLVELGEGEDGKADYSPLVREISNTLTFARNQYRDLQMDHVVLGGVYSAEAELRDVIAETSGLKVTLADPWGSWGIRPPRDDLSGWETAVGLAVRELL